MTNPVEQPTFALMSQIVKHCTISVFRSQASTINYKTPLGNHCKDKNGYRVEMHNKERKQERGSEKE